MTSKTNAELADALIEYPASFEDHDATKREAARRLRAMPDAATPDEWAILAAREIMAMNYPPGDAITNVATIISKHYAHPSDEVARLKMYEDAYRRAAKACGWMQEDKSLGLHLGDETTSDGVVALKKQRDDLRAEVLRLRAALVNAKTNFEELRQVPFSLEPKIIGMAVGAIDSALNPPAKDAK